jgi:integrase
MSKQNQTSFRKVAECLYRNESSGAYYAFVKRNGRQIRRSLKTKDRKLAERRLKEFRGDADKLVSGGRNRISFIQLGEIWKPVACANLKKSSADRIGRCLRTLNTFFGDRIVSAVTMRDCEEWEVSRGKGIAASTFNKDAQVLKACLQYAVDRGMLLDNPSNVIKHRRITDKRIVIPTKEQFDKLCDTILSLDPRAREAFPLVKLLATSGMRLAEAINITWGEIDFDKDYFVVSGGEVGTKNRQVRTVPLFPAMKKFIESYYDTENTESNEYLFKFKSARKALETACRVAKLPHFTHHCLRHYFVSNAIEKGIDFKTIANWIGHKDGGLLVAKTYGHLRDVHSHQMAKLMTE